MHLFLWNDRREVNLCSLLCAFSCNLEELNVERFFTIRVMLFLFVNIKQDFELLWLFNVVIVQKLYVMLGAFDTMKTMADGIEQNVIFC